MDRLVRERPFAATLAAVVVVVAVAVAGRLVVAPLVPWLTLDGVGLVLNWAFVVLTLALVAGLGWWDEVRLRAPVRRRALVYLLPFAAMVAVPLAVGVRVPEVSLVRGAVLSPAATTVALVVGVALGAAVFEELLFRGVLLRALEPRGRLVAAVTTAMAFGLTHVAKIVLGGPVGEWLVSMALIVPLGVGLAAVAFRLESLWPLVVWHFAVDVAGLFGASDAAAARMLATVTLVVVVGAVGLWLCWRDDRAAGRSDPGVVPEPVESRAG
jgi:membrane protease YdiL (CAAX protease family)